MKFCTNCGTEIEWAQFCTNCGTQIVEQDPLLESQGKELDTATIETRSRAVTPPPKAKPPQAKPPIRKQKETSSAPVSAPPQSKPPTAKPNETNPASVLVPATHLARMTKCSNCGRPCYAHEAFCSGCGKQLKVNSQESASASSPSSAANVTYPVAAKPTESTANSMTPSETIRNGRSAIEPEKVKSKSSDHSTAFAWWCVVLIIAAFFCWIDPIARVGEMLNHRQNPQSLSPLTNQPTYASQPGGDDSQAAPQAEMSRQMDQWSSNQRKQDEANRASDERSMKRQSLDVAISDNESRIDDLNRQYNSNGYSDTQKQDMENEGQRIKHEIESLKRERDALDR